MTMTCPRCGHTVKAKQGKGKKYPAPHGCQPAAAA